jgi:hypothetical protein
MPAPKKKRRAKAGTREAIRGPSEYRVHKAMKKVAPKRRGTGLKRSDAISGPREMRVHKAAAKKRKKSR